MEELPFMMDRTEDIRLLLLRDLSESEEMIRSFLSFSCFCLMALSLNYP